ncbi:CPBP family intramembrane glutamic endopeptidase [Furfurilactobacillus entadae]|uniref:CPBP family intramembrane glutamic endopeptidase n=1 Tax=Furfurilactobacillus entadae TaxID=2922307 RepID=UPI0035E4D0D3
MKMKGSFFILINLVFIVVLGFWNFPIEFILKNQSGQNIGILEVPTFELLLLGILVIIGKRAFKVVYGFREESWSNWFIFGWPLLLLGFGNFFQDNYVWKNLIKVPFTKILLIVLLATLSALIVSMFEEVVMRGGVFNGLMALSPKLVKTNILISGSIFGLSHALNYLGRPFWDTTNQIVYAIGIGVLFTTIYYLTSNIWIVILLHTFVDTTSFIFGMHQSLVGTGTASSIDVSSLIILIFGILYSEYLLRTVKRSKKIIGLRAVE